MKKLTLLFLSVIIFGGMSIAQENRFSAGIDLAFPMADFAEVAGIGFGASIGYELPIGTKAGVTAALGVLSFTGKDIEFGKRGVDYQRINTINLMIPVQIGLKYYILENQGGFYLGAQTGLHVISSKTEIERDMVVGVNVVRDTNETSDSSVSFGVAPGIGYHLSNVDIGLRYQILFEDVSTSYLGVRLAYVFGG